MRAQWIAAACCLATLLPSVASAAPTDSVYQEDQKDDKSGLRMNNAPSWWSPSPFQQTQTPFHGGEKELETYSEDEEDDVDDVEGEEHDDLDGKSRHRKKKGWVYLIRHGEKFKHSDKTGLSEKGIQRAKCLTEVFVGRSRGGRHQRHSGTHEIDYIIAQDFKPSGQRRRPYETVKPLAKKYGIPLHHSCDRDDPDCVVSKIKKRSRRGENVLVVWEHARLSHIADALGVKGLVYPSDRYDIVFKIRGGKVHSIFSEECDGLDGEWSHWKAKRKGRHGKSPLGGRLIDDESWADNESRHD